MTLMVILLCYYINGSRMTLVEQYPEPISFSWDQRIHRNSVSIYITTTWHITLHLHTTIISNHIQRSNPDFHIHISPWMPPAYPQQIVTQCQVLQVLEFLYVLWKSSDLIRAQVEFYHLRPCSDVCNINVCQKLGQNHNTGYTYCIHSVINSPYSNIILTAQDYKTAAGQCCG